MYKVKNSGVLCSFKTVLVVLVMCLSMHLSVKANNVRLNGTVKVTDVTSGVATLELDLTWDNSWRDNFNWDAVWLFLKYKPASGKWDHVWLMDGTEVSPGYEVKHGRNWLGNGNTSGVYVFLDGNGTKQQASTKVTLKWNCGTRYTKADFDENRVFLLAQGIEMVYIPFGAYYLGDGASNNTLGAADDKPLVMNGEGATTLYQRESNGTRTAINLPADYPKGYQGFYVMKYETSQEQYVTFLNTLTKQQQETQLGASLLASLSPGDYIFGSASQPSYRNGIVLSAKPEGQPYVFDNDLNVNGVYGEDGDGQCVACNYMSLRDALNYAEWAGLRPMSELEYERVCRAPFPQKPVEREYVWNSNSGLSRVTSITAKGEETEEANNTTCNVNSGNGLTGDDLGPVRCGLFARSSSTQLTAGATFWGVMEMGGNVQEIVANISHTNLKRLPAQNGGGYWGGHWFQNLEFFGVRGGSFAGADSLLRISDRSKIYSYFPDWDSRDSTVGFRLVRTLDDGVDTVNPGTISLSGPLCPGVESTVSETAAASVAGGLPITYIWSYSTNNGSTWTLIPDATGNELTYSAFVAGWTYLFRRTAVCALGEASTQTSSGITASALTVITRHPVDTVDAHCAININVAATGTSLTYQWEKDGVAITGANTNNYYKEPTALSDRGRYVCKVTGACGALYSNDALAVAVELEHQYEDDEFIDPRDNERYKIRKMPDGHWWMIENLRFGINNTYYCNAANFKAYSGQSVQRVRGNNYGVCMPASSNIAKDGYLYNWQAAMNHPGAFHNNTAANQNPAGNVWNTNNPTQWQGICPDGWHLPSAGGKSELYKLLNALCWSGSDFGPAGAFEGVLGGYANGSTVSNAGSEGRYWSSTYQNYTKAWFMYSNSSVASYTYMNRSVGAAVRCVKNY